MIPIMPGGATLLGGRLAGGRTTVLAGLVAHREATHTAREEGERVVLALVIEIIGWASRGGAVRGRLESSLSGTAIERAGRVGAGAGAEVSIQRRVGSSASSNARRKGIGARGPAKVLTAVVTAGGIAGGGRGEGAMAGSITHRRLAHGIVRTTIHGRGVARVGDHGSSSSAGTATETTHILGKVMVTADLVAALPVTSTEGNDTAASHTTTTVAMAHGTVVSHVLRGRHHGRRAIAVSVADITGRTGGERASEAGGTTLEVGEAARRAGPVAGSGSVLAGRERGENFGGTVQNTARRGGDLNSLLVERPTVHTQALGSLFNWRSVSKRSKKRGQDKAREA